MSLTVDNISAMYNTNNISDRTNKLQDTLQSDLSTATDDELMDVCKEFESYFTEQMFKAMQKMVPESGDEISASTKQMQDYYREQMVQTMAQNSVDGEGLGIAQVLYEQMKRNYGLE